MVFSVTKYVCKELGLKLTRGAFCTAFGDLCLVGSQYRTIFDIEELLAAPKLGR